MVKYKWPAWQYLISPHITKLLKWRVRYLINFYNTRYYISLQKKYEKIARRIRLKDKINVAFFVIHDSVWKYEGIYRLLSKNEKFEPVVIICPYVMYGNKNMFNEMTQAYDSFAAKGYKVKMAYNESTKKWMDVKKEVKPDIVFFTNPHKLTKDEYYITNFTDCLTCYVPYNFGNSHLFQLMHNQVFHNMLWRLFAETDIHREYSIKYADNKGINVVVTGFPGTDVFIDKSYVSHNIWKPQAKDLKKIIWAPHHTIDNDTSFLCYSSFLRYAEFMLKLAGEMEDKIQFAFKPHPILLNKLNSESTWGPERTAAYYKRWNELKNGQYVSGDYADLFLGSDAMIHDSGSFLIEYLYTGKPVLHTNRDDHLTDRLNDFGILAFNLHYHAKNEEDIRSFIEDVLNGSDVKKQEREAFLISRLYPPNHKSASENVYDEIMKCLN